MSTPRTVPFRPRPAPPFSALRRRYTGRPVTIRLRTVPGLLEARVVRFDAAAAILRTWTAEGARGCRLCRRGCNATINGDASCAVYAPPGVADEDAPGFEAEHPMQFHKAQPRAPVAYAKPRDGRP